MPAEEKPIRPRNFFLNEQHELTLAEKTGRGGLPKYGPINWASKATRINQSLSKVREAIQSSSDPLKESRFFLLAEPEKQLIKRSERKGVQTEIEYTVNYAKDDSRVFSRLGLDLLQVNEDGSAIVHSRPEQLDRVLATSKSLDKIGIREQYRWAPIGAFAIIPPQLRIDYAWLSELQRGVPTDAVIELQPLLTRAEIDKVLSAISGFLRKEEGEGLTRAGTDFSGRHWWRGRIRPDVLQRLAKSFFSIQSLHSPLYSLAAGKTVDLHGERLTARFAVDRQTADKLPTVAVLDTGIPDDHLYLAPYRRGRYSQYGASYHGNHGSFVASRIVFGDAQFDVLANIPQGTCRFYDAMISDSDSDIDDKRIIDAMRSITGTAPDVRVFNLSFDTREPLEMMRPTQRAEKLRLVQDLDNFAFANDVIICVAAGNTPHGLTPNPRYPQHLNDPNWALGAWATGFNSLTCGSTVELATLGGLVTDIGWPSPFTRIGPGLCQSPKPDFCSHGGNVSSNYTFASGLGVWGYNASGVVEDHPGTSGATPLLAREAAFAVTSLQQACEQGARPFGVTVKAFLTLTATPPISTSETRDLVINSLGRGYASSTRLSRPLGSSAVLIWQGVLESPKDIVRVRIPVPLAWVKDATNPTLRLCLAWDSPVNAAAHDLWACRKITAHLKPNPEGDSLMVSRRPLSHKSYPLILREYSLKKPSLKLDGDTWILEISYEQIADYYPGIDFTPEQRVAFAAELVDKAEKPVSPQRAMQNLPAMATMTRLSLAHAIVRSPILLKMSL
jgi:hypothetical protein